MKKFEYIEILKPTIKEKELKNHIESVKEYFNKMECKNVNIENVGIKNLAYNVKEYSKGLFLVFTGEVKNKEIYNKIDKYLYSYNKSFMKDFPEVLKNIFVSLED